MSPQMPSSPAKGEWTLLATDSKGFRAAWQSSFPSSNPTASRARKLGERTLSFAVPPGTVPVVTVESQQSDSGAGSFTVTPTSRFRDVTLAAMVWNPGGFSGLSRVRIASFRIDFKTVSGRNFRSAFAPPANSPAEQALSSWLINYVQSRNFRSAPVTVLAKSSAAGPGPSAFLPRQRLLIKTRGQNIEVVEFAALDKAGLPLSSIDPRYMRLYQDGVEKPMYIQGQDDGHWDPGDFIEFIGNRPVGVNSYNSFYSATADFMLTWGGGTLGLRAPFVPVAPRQMSAGIFDSATVKRAQPFHVHDHQEQDLEILRIGSTSADDIVDLGSRVEENELTDFWFWTKVGTQKDSRDVEFNLGYNAATQAFGTDAGSSQASGAGDLRIVVNLKGVTNNSNADPDHHVKFLLNGTDISLVGGARNDAVWEGQNSFTWKSSPLKPGILLPGKNVLTMQKVNDLFTSNGTLVENQDAYLNYFELDFPASYKVQGDMLRFSNSFPDSVGNVGFSLDGFSTAAVSIWDLAGRKLANFGITNQGSRIQINLVDSLSGATSYLACGLDKREKPDLHLDTLPDLLNPSEGADDIFITQKYLRGPALDSLVAFHRKQGLRCAIVMADHIYQTFGDGSMDPAAIRRFTQYAYANWPRPAPTYLTLVGDASTWFDKQSGSFQVTTVPTHLVNISGWGVAADDDYFAKVNGEDDLADLFIGRIPVTTPAELSGVVHKTILLETARPAGHWQNKALLISGYESSFMDQNSVLESIAAANDRQISRVDLYPGSPYYEDRIRLGNFLNQLDSGFNLVTFVGHGGGAVWSDAGVLTLKEIDAGKVNGDFPIPLVASITCLTGYFEDVAARSLGEEMVRLEKGGAASFYGAAGYISNAAGTPLSSELVSAATGNVYGTVGALITQSENLVRLKTGDAFLPILAEFNLLGDPALHLSFASAEGILTLQPQSLGGTLTLRAHGEGLAMDKADGIATIYFGDSVESETPISVTQGAFDLTHHFTALPTTLAAAMKNGKVIVDYWDDGKSREVSAPFSSLDWLIDSVGISPADAAPGDSVSIQMRLATVYPKTSFQSGVALFAVGPSDAAPAFPDESQQVLQSADGVHFQSAHKVKLLVPPGNFVHPRAYLAFRIFLQVMNDLGQPMQTLSNLNSRTYSVPLSELARLEIPTPAFRLPIQDKLGVWIPIHNRGLGTAKLFSLALTEDPQGAQPIFDTLRFSGELGTGKIDSLFFNLADSMVNGKTLRVELLPARPGEVAAVGAARDSVLHVQTILLGAGDDFTLDPQGTKVSLSKSGKPARIFVERSPLDSLPGYLRPASMRPVPTGGPDGRMHISLSSNANSANEWIVSAVKKPPGISAGVKTTANSEPIPPGPAWHYRDDQGLVWLKLDSLSDANMFFNSRLLGNGYYALLQNSDLDAPLIQMSSRGQTLLPDDFVPLHTAIDIVIRDGQGVDLVSHPPVVTLNGASPDSTALSRDASRFPTLARLNFLPKRTSGLDSLRVVARDISGNIAAKTLVYRMGESLSIKDLGAYPNPFADTTTFVFSLTDYCDRVDLKVYSRAGRLVRGLEERNVVGYQEVPWDGRGERGGEIANGLYFLKVTATAGSSQSTRIFKLFKKRRK